MSVKIGIIGGSGFYKMGILDNTEELEINTPFGKPSDNITIGKISGVEVAFLPRHGKGHAIAPHNINYSANVFALKECGVEYLISIAAVGSLKKEIKPCDFVIADQLIDRTAKRKSTFFEDGIVAHVSFADPFCKTLSDLAYETVKKEGVDVHRGTYICMEGPQFSTRAESNLYRSWNVDIIGMTLATEAKLAREAEMCLCAILTVTDYDCWYEGEEDVSVRNVVDNLKKNDKNVANILNKLIPKIKYKRTCSCHNALEHAVITTPELIEKNGNPFINKVLLKRFTK
ncbi:S-methyl-5'-thioadenosine phosphorylase [Thermoplasmatales archaeon SG8-52-1]|nr:MAG: S-methyl-5'-thioadenosine phosphorylase [Thermoplasmatales archaeon SG8-52-1]